MVFNPVVYALLALGVGLYFRAVRVLGARGYDQWYVIEQDTAPGDPTETARTNRMYLEELLGVTA